MRLWIAICFCASLAAAPAGAGAWLRDKGRGFTATSSMLTDQMETKSSFYFEYGLTAQTTVGLNLDMTMSGLGQSGTAFVFARRALPFGGKQSLWAYELAMGARFDGASPRPLAGLGLSYGRPFKLGAYDGWLGVETALRWDFATTRRTLKIDTVAGLTFSERSKTMVQVFWSADSLGYTSTTFSPSYIYTPKRGKFSYLVGVEAARSHTTRYGIKLGLWREF
ncbi:hypothetical protein [Pseudosulfitobacter sp. DSM 107133]|uniref:hypothetical protein n=1 Tax=Pseudosulfitobacter sp. DSM 107133 TaxID=2883100 RepID=UPI000DF35889|nr:hypothetical protein [Pseudosulfitobacter sp. DSM 107133]UOA25805.1 hypothetical protein DSM107133_00492 [Pseudosulfitobacter sp. DSM 107133]